jgi:hypothetical protein
LSNLPRDEFFGDSTTCASKVRPSIQGSHRYSRKMGLFVRLAS